MQIYGISIGLTGTQALLLFWYTGFLDKLNFISFSFDFFSQLKPFRHEILCNVIVDVVLACLSVKNSGFVWPLIFSPAFCSLNW
jgi:hypothetical protein